MWRIVFLCKLRFFCLQLLEKNVLMVVLPMFVVVIVGQDVTSLAPTARNPESSLSPKPETLIPKPLPDFDLGSSILPLTSEPHRVHTYSETPEPVFFGRAINKFCAK